ncbi:MAG: nucleotidyltransferase family protein [Hyphomicrobiaceae bacterium]
MDASPKFTRAMVLGAGMGSRMRDLTRDQPKPMVEVGGKRLIDHVLDRLAGAGITHAVINVHYQADVLERHLKKRGEPYIIISDERDVLLDTGGGVTRALPHFRNEPFFIHNADSIWLEKNNPTLIAMMHAWDPDRMDSLLLLASTATSLGYDGDGDFVMSETGALTRRTGDDAAPHVFAGVSIAHPRLFANAPEGAFSLNRLWDEAIAANRLYGMELDGQWMHVGTPEAVAEAGAVLASRG